MLWYKFTGFGYYFSESNDTFWTYITECKDKIYTSLKKTITKLEQRLICFGHKAGCRTEKRHNGLQNNSQNRVTAKSNTKTKILAMSNTCSYTSEFREKCTKYCHRIDVKWFNTYCRTLRTFKERQAAFQKVSMI